VLAPASGCTIQNYISEDGLMLRQEKNKTLSTKIVVLFAACPQGQCVQTRQMVIFHINLYSPKVYRRPDHFVCAVEQHKLY
jgi:hypothetical protein